MIARLIELLVVLVGLFGGGGLIGLAYYRRSRPTAPDKCKHRRWSPWVTIETIPVHYYAEVDEGKGLPDRVDALMERECVVCHIRQDKTVRGIDSPHYK